MAGRNNKNNKGKFKKKTSSTQLSLFQVIKDNNELIDNSEFHKKNLDISLDYFHVEEKNYSNMTEIWDLLPRYHFSNKQIDKLEFPWLTIRDGRYQVTLIPTVIKNDPNSKTIKGAIRAKFPGLREMYIEEALTKLATSEFQNRLKTSEIELDDSSKQYLVSVNFTLYQLQQELKSFGHTYSLTQIKEGLQILNQTTIAIKAITRDPENPEKELYLEHRGPIISELQFASNDMKLESEQTLSRVVFHQLKTISVMNIAYRKYNYEKSMHLPSYLSKYIYNRLVLNWRQANAINEYSFRMYNLLNESCRENSKTIYTDARAMRTALDELVESNILKSYTQDPIRESGRSVDIRFSLVPNKAFIYETINANMSQRKLKEKHQEKRDSLLPKMTSEEYINKIKNMLKK